MIFESSMFVGKDKVMGSIAQIEITGTELATTPQSTRIVTVHVAENGVLTTEWHNNTYRYHNEVTRLLFAAKNCVSKMTSDGRIRIKNGACTDLPPLYEISVSNMNYLFLRGLSGKDTFPQNINEELSMFLGALCTCITENHSDLPKIKSIVSRELEEGCYARSSRELCVKAKDYMLSHPEMELSKDEINIVCNFYEDLQLSIEKGAEREEY